MRHNYVVYADFESRLEHVDDSDTVPPAAAYRRHVAMSYAYILVTEDPRFKMTEPSFYRGKMANHRFLDGAKAAPAKAAAISGESKVIVSNLVRPSQVLCRCLETSN